MSSRSRRPIRAWPFSIASESISPTTMPAILTRDPIGRPLASRK
jgi:hypothetical protein